jgi:hypothetical protein
MHLCTFNTYSLVDADISKDSQLRPGSISVHRDNPSRFLWLFFLFCQLFFHMELDLDQCWVSWNTVSLGPGNFQAWLSRTKGDEKS